MTPTTRNDDEPRPTMSRPTRGDDEPRPAPPSNRRENDLAVRPVDTERAEFHREVAAKRRRVQRAREEGDRTMKAGWGAFGVVGWSIVVPTLIGLVVGLWLDGRLGGGVRYTLSLLALGLVIGMVNVWNWMNAQ